MARFLPVAPRWRGGGWLDRLLRLGVGISGGCSHWVHQHLVAGQDLDVKCHGFRGKIYGFYKENRWILGEKSMDLGEKSMDFGGKIDWSWGKNRWILGKNRWIFGGKLIDLGGKIDGFGGKIDGKRNGKMNGEWGSEEDVGAWAVLKRPRFLCHGQAWRIY